MEAGGLSGSMPPAGSSTSLIYANNARPEAGSSSSAAALAEMPSAASKFIWFKWVCAGSWLIIVLNLVLLITAASALGQIIDVGRTVCDEPEINTGASCPSALSCFAECVDDTSLVTSSRMRDCFVGGCSSGGVCTGCSATGAARAYNLSQRYLNSSISLVYAQQLMLSARRRLEVERGLGVLVPASSAPAPCTCANLTTCCLLWQGAADPGYQCDASASCNADACARECEPEAAAASGASVRTAAVVLRAAYATAWGQPARDALVAAAAAAAAAADGASSFATGSEGSAGRRRLSVAADRDAAYVNVAVASTIALLGDGRLEPLYGWLVALAVLGLLPAYLALLGVGNGPPHCCDVPSRVERMHKVEMRCACHCGYLWGVVVLMLVALALCKFQVLLGYLTEDQDALPAVWNYSGGVAAVTVPCTFGVLVSLLPVFMAMALSRARAERRDAMATDFSIKRYKRDPSKELTAPRPVLRGEPPNPAMLNPVMDPLYAANVPTGASSGRVDTV